MSTTMSEGARKHIQRARRRKGISEGDLVVTFSGVVHTQDCDLLEVVGWKWAGRNNLIGDKPCLDCLPSGLPDGNPPHQFDAAEIKRLRPLAGFATEESR